MKDRRWSCASTECVYLLLIAAASAACIAIMVKLESTRLHLHAHGRRGAHTLQDTLADAAAAAAASGSSFHRSLSFLRASTAPAPRSDPPSALRSLQSWLSRHAVEVDSERGRSWFVHTPVQVAVQGWNGAPVAAASRAPAQRPLATPRLEPSVGVDPYFGSGHDLTSHKTNDMCWSHFDFGMLQEWDATARLFCAPLDEVEVGASAAKGGALRARLESTHAAWLVCRVMHDSHLPGPTAPHTMCDGSSIVFDFNRMSQSQCPANRPGYKCEGAPVYYNYAPGALTAQCAKQPALNSFSFPRDHLMDIFNSFEGVQGAMHDEGAIVDSDAPVTLFVTRERAEHANPFHATTDFMNAFYTLHVAGVIDGLTGSRVGMENVQVVLLDEQLGPFDEPFWHTVFSPAHAVQRPSTLVGTGSGRVRFQRALFVPPGYTNVLLAHVLSEGDCHAATHAFQAYRKFVLAGMGVHPAPHILAPDDEGDVTVTFVSRRPYHKYVDHAFIGRQISNEDELLQAMAAVPRVNVHRVDFAQLEVQEQLSTIANTELLVGMHGAALTYAMYLPSYAGVLELWPTNADIWRCFEHISAMSGMHYVRWENNNPGNFYKDNNGDYTRVDIASFDTLLRGAVEEVLRRRAAFADTPPAALLVE